MGHLISLQIGKLVSSLLYFSLEVTILQSIPTREALFSMRARRYLGESMGFLKRLMYQSWVFLMSAWVSWLSCRQRIFMWVKMLNLRGTSAKKLLDRSNLMRPVHLEMVGSQVCLMLVPARINSFRDAGSLMNELICSYYYSPFLFFIYATLTYLLYICHPIPQPPKNM